MAYIIGIHTIWAILYGSIIYGHISVVPISFYISDSVPTSAFQRNSKLFESEDAKNICSRDCHMAWAWWWGEGTAGDKFEDWEFDWFKVLLDIGRRDCSFSSVTCPRIPFRNTVLVSWSGLTGRQESYCFLVEGGKIRKWEIIQQQEQHCLIINIGLWIKN